MKVLYSNCITLSDYVHVTLAKVNYDLPPPWNMYAQGGAHNEEQEGKRKG